jgi:uncharacterized protein (DUF1778 family)
MSRPTIKTARLDFKVKADTREILERRALEEGRTMTDVLEDAVSQYDLAPNPAE